MVYEKESGEETEEKEKFCFDQECCLITCI